MKLHVGVLACLTWRGPQAGRGGITCLRWEGCAALQQLASHGLFNVMVQAEGDTWIDDHHTNEDIGAPGAP